MSESDQDDDYMNDAFLLEIPQEKSYTQKRAHKLNQSLAKNKKPKLIQQQEELDLGLSKEISQDNKGYQMLVKMGYKGGGLGTDNAGIQEPVQVQLRKQGLGLGNVKDTASTQRFVSVKEKKEIERDIENKSRVFIESMNSKYEDKLDLADLTKARLACMTMDERNNLPRSEFWPLLETPKSGIEGYSSVVVEEDDAKQLEFEENSTFDKLFIVNQYLRQKYFYCIWCGIEYKSKEDLRNCPGNERDDHED